MADHDTQSRIDDFEDEGDLIKRYFPVAAVGSFISSEDIIESCKDMLVMEKPELLQIDLSKKRFDQEFDGLAINCLHSLFKKLDIKDKLVVYDPCDLTMNHQHGCVFIGVPIIMMNDSETKLQFVERVGTLIANLNLKYERIPEINPNETDGLEIFERDQSKEMMLMLCMITDVLTILTPRFEGERDDEDDVYDMGFNEGIDMNYERVQVSLYKMWKKGLLKTDNYYEFLDDLHNINVGFSDADYDKVGKEFQAYYKKMSKPKEKKPKKVKPQLLLENGEKK